LRAEVGEIGCGFLASALVTLRAMDRRLARRNLRTALITAVIGLLMFALTFVAAELYI
jgi:predicted secreted protein